MAANDKAVDALRKLASQGKHLDRETGRTGRWDEANNRIHPNATVGLTPNRIWVRLGATLANPRGRALVIAWNFNRVTTRRADRAVELELNASGQYRVVGADEEAATVQNGVLATYDFRGDAPPPELNDANNRTENLFELKPYSPAGLLVGVKPGWVGRRYWWDSVTLALTPTATASRMAWAVLYIDTSGASLVLGQALGADKSLAYTKNLADVETLLATLPDTAVPICAVLLANGATTVNLNDAPVFDDVRALVNTGGGGGGGHEILVDDVPQVQRAGLNLLSSDWLKLVASDDAGNDETDVGYTLDPDGVTQLSSIDATADKLPVWDNDTSTIKWINRDDLLSGGSPGDVVVTSVMGRLAEVVYDNTLAVTGTWDVSGIPQDGDELEIILLARATSTTTAKNIYMWYNNDTTAANYRSGQGYAGTSSVDVSATDEPRAGVITDNGATAGYFGISHIKIPAYAGSQFKIADHRSNDRRSATDIYTTYGTHHWESAAAITRIQIRTDNHPTHLFEAGSRLIILKHKAQSVVTNVTGGVLGGIIEYSDAVVSNPPTQAELVAEFGAASAFGTNKLVNLDNGGTGTNVYRVSSDGTDYFYTTATKAL